MCGIAGLLATVPFDGTDTIQRMTDALLHRGPDGDGFVALDPSSRRVAPADLRPQPDPARVWLGHRRLSIIDLVGSRLPLCNEESTVWVTFNGEICSYQELRSQLEQRGHRLREKGDTEVLVHLWQDFGEDMLAHLGGGGSLSAVQRLPASRARWVHRGVRV